MQVVLQVFSKPPKIPPARSLRPDKKKQNVNVFMKKSDSKECKPNLEFKKVKYGANHSKNWAKLTKHASCTFSQ